MNESETGQEPPTEATAAPRRRRHWGRWLLGVFVVAPITLFALWTLVSVSWAYSRGESAGFVQKFSRRGWLCKTWEGELAMVPIPGAMQEKWQFTVRSDTVARALEAAMGHQVRVSYDQHVGVPTSCFGDTEYYVTAVDVIKP